MIKALCGRQDGRPDLPDAGVDRASADQRRTRRRFIRSYQRHGRRLRGGQADRRVSRRGAGAGPEMSGYQLAVSMDIFRRTISRQFLNIHRRLRPACRCVTVLHCRPRITYFCRAIASWCRSSRARFPLYDRNPQIYVPNIFYAKPEDYVEGDANRSSGPRINRARSGCRWFRKPRDR